MILAVIISVTFRLAVFVQASSRNEFTVPGAKGIVKYEALLVDHILGNYSKNSRPVLSSKVPAKIKFAFQLNKLVGLDIKDQVLIIDSFILMEWEDPQLSWNPMDYNGTNIVNIHKSYIWTPDIVLYNMAEANVYSYLTSYSSPVIAKNTGTVKWTNVVTLKASCNIDITWFPFDTQTCTLKFGSWSLSSSRLMLSFLKKQQDVQSLIDEGGMHVTNGAWDLMDFHSARGSVNFSCCQESFSEIKYSFTLKRLPQFFLLYLIFPCLAIVGLALLSFVIPPDGGERIGFGVTVILSFSVYLIVISDKLPEISNKVPLLGILFVSVLYTLVVSFILSTISVRLSSNTHLPPEWLLRMARGRNCAKLTACKTEQSCGRNGGKVEALDLQETGEKKEDLSYGIKAKDRACVSCSTSDSEAYQKEWKLIASYLDKLFFKFILFVIFLLPTLIFSIFNKM